MPRLTVIALALFLSTAWGSAVVRVTATALGLEAQEPLLLPEGPQTESGCSMDPWGCPEGGHP